MKALKNNLSASKIGVWLGVTTFECFLVFSFVLMFLGFVAAYVVFTAIDAVLKPRMRK